MILLTANTTNSPDAIPVSKSIPPPSYKHNQKASSVPPSSLDATSSVRGRGGEYVLDGGGGGEGELQWLPITVGRGGGQDKEHCARHVSVAVRVLDSRSSALAPASRTHGRPASTASSWRMGSGATQEGIGDRGGEGMGRIWSSLSRESPDSRDSVLLASLAAGESEMIGMGASERLSSVATSTSGSRHGMHSSGQPCHQHQDHGSAASNRSGLGRKALMTATTLETCVDDTHGRQHRDDYGDMSHIRLGRRQSPLSFYMSGPIDGWGSQKQSEGYESDGWGRDSVGVGHALLGVASIGGVLGRTTSDSWRQKLKEKKRD